MILLISLDLYYVDYIIKYTNHTKQISVKVLNKEILTYGRRSTYPTVVLKDIKSDEIFELRTSLTDYTIYEKGYSYNININDEKYKDSLFDFILKLSIIFLIIIEIFILWIM